MRASWLLRAAVGAVPAVFWVSSALAADSVDFSQCTHQPTAADIDGAKGAHKAASQFFERADYDRAIQYWRDAYGFDCTRPAILLNIASAYEKKGDRATAVTTLEAYLSRAPNAADAPTISERVKNLKASLEPKPETVVGPEEPPAPPPPEAPVEPVEPLPIRTERPFGIAPVVLAGIGGAITVVGAIFLPIGLDGVGSANDQCPSRQNCPLAVAEAGNDARTKLLVGELGLGVGITTLAAGLVWQFGFNKPKPVTVSVVPALGPGLSGVAVAGAF